MLKSSQQKIYDDIIQAIEKGEKRLILQGSAGTGKTYLVSVLVEYFASKIKRWDESKVWVTAPTNKALSILQKKIPSSKGIKFATIHSALKLQRYVNPKTGVVSFKPAKGGEKPFSKCTLAIVDECSMLNSELIKYMDSFGFPIIFVGKNHCSH